ncbi:MAG: serine/threonine protein kinase [Candidatus Obscuribacterales bacterium]|nr:serine/threonine protein kinase [Candidatus Obscuribacterales bacterium]
MLDSIAESRLQIKYKMHEQSENWIDRFNFIQPLGGGGMGEVYLAEDTLHDDRQCVVKKILNEKKDLNAQIEMIKICQREAELLRKLNHRGIVKFLDDHYSEEGLYVVMEYIPGSNLEEVVQKEGSLDSETVVRIGIQCCDVLEYLHSEKPPIIYRDLKPSNLMLRPDGLVVFVDFGIARDFEPKGPATRVITSGYSPPEQYFGQPEPRGDLYSLGATMHHLLTGVRPKPLTPCKPMHLNPNVLPALDSLITRCTSHEKDERPPSARAVQFELFKIYKSIHPEFEIPELGIDEDAELELEERKQEALQSARFRNMNLKAAKPSKDSKGRLNEFDDTETGGNTLVAKIRQWLGNLTGRKLD